MVRPNKKKCMRVDVEGNMLEKIGMVGRDSFTFLCRIIPQFPKIFGFSSIIRIKILPSLFDYLPSQHST